MRNRPLIPDDVAPDVPLRLGVVAAIAFPYGSMIAAGLRRELFMLNPIADEDLASVWAKRGTHWRNNAVMRVLP